MTNKHSLQSSAGAAVQADARIINILYGTQTGNSESIAHDAAASAKAHGLMPNVKCVDEVEIDQLTQMEYLLFITSTYGDGEMPDNVQLLWDKISEDSSPGMENIQYSVLALGDSSFNMFCKAGIDWDNRLEALGATRIYARVDCDVDFEDAAENWVNAVIPLMANGVVQPAPAFIDTETATDKPKFNRKNPFPAKMLVNRLVTGESSSKEVRHYEISLAGSGLNYEAGDTLNIIATNCPELVEDIIKAIGCSGSEDEPVNGVLMTLREALRTHFEIKLPSKEFISEIANLSGDQELNDILGSGDNDALADYLWGRDILDLVLQFPEVKFSAAEFSRLLKPLQHRAYSTSSSGKMYPDAVHLTVSSVRYESYDRDHKGVCSTYLADLVDKNTEIRCFITPNHIFRVPENNDLPIIMVGPGTGIAPFRAFLQEREIRKASGKNWLIFGDRNASCDFLYQEELEAMQNNGLLTRLDLAFSRDQAEKIYVQDRMLESGTELFAWLEQGGYFFVCGDAYRMAKNVDQALHDVISEHGNMSAEQAIEYVNNMKKEKRYVRDVY